MLHWNSNWTNRLHALFAAYCRPVPSLRLCRLCGKQQMPCAYTVIWFLNLILPMYDLSEKTLQFCKSEPGGDRQGRMRVSPRYILLKITLVPPPSPARGINSFSNPTRPTLVTDCTVPALHRGRRCATHQRGATESSQKSRIMHCAVRETSVAGGSASREGEHEPYLST